MADLISETQARLLTVTAENQTVAAAFEVSYQDLDAGQQRFFRHLGLHPGADIDAYAAAALAGLPLEEASGYLDGLHGCRVLEEPVPHRYRMHDLIRQYARTLAPDAASGERQLAIGRLLDYYQHTAEAADTRLGRHSRTPAATPVPAPAAAPGLPGQSQAQAWMTAERANLVACIGHAAAREDHARVTGLTAAIAAHLRSDGPWPQATTLHAAAARAAQHIGDQPGYANALLNLGDVLQLTGDYPGATDLLGQARDIYRGIGSRLGEANALFYLGDVRRLTGDFPGATGLLEAARDIYRDLGSRLGEANTLCRLGTVAQATGDYPAATGLLEQARDIYRGIGDRLGESVALIETGAMHLTRGDPQQARTHYQRALQLSRTIGSQLEEARALEGIGKCAAAIPAADDANSTLRQALDIYQRIGAADATRLAAEINNPR